jgi:hypothetical protein
MNRAVVVVVLLACSSSLFGCDRLMKERKKVESLLASASAAAASASAALAQLPTAAPTPVPAPAAPAVTDDQIPAPEDYEQQAAKDITAANMQAELDKLKRDIGP